MKRLLRLALIAVLPALAVGCQSLGIEADLPVILPIGESYVLDANPVHIPLSSAQPEEYGRVFEKILQVLGDYGFEVAEPHRYSGRVDAVPRVSPGLVLFFKPGSPDLYDRLLSTFQTYRHRVTVMIEPVAKEKGGGYFIEFIARKELEDLPKPLKSTAGSAVFRSENTLERQTEVIDETFFDSSWIYRGRDAALEQELIRRFKKAL
jgi:hypothetical protein